MMEQATIYIKDPFDPNLGELINIERPYVADLV